MNTEAEDPKAFHQRMWREYGPKQAPSLGGAVQAIIEQARNDIRDAALEDAATVDLAGMTEWARGVVRERIRAMKSKPAPKWEPDSPTDLPDEEQPQPELVPLAVGPTDRDFGWALQQMRAGKKVRRPGDEEIFGPGDIVRPIRFSYNDAIIHNDGTDARLSHSDLRATDWEVVE